MIPHARNNMFSVKLPRNFFYDDIKSRYEFYIKRLPNPYESITDFMNFSIQGISFPSVNLETVTQQLQSDAPIKWRDGFNFERHVDKTFTITFKLFEGYINYWIMFEQLRMFYSDDSREENFNPIRLSFLDGVGMEFIAFEFQKVLFTGLSELTLDFSSTTPEFQTFDATFAYNYFEVKKDIR